MLPRVGSFAALLVLTGCAKPPRTIEAAFPVSAQASPWVLRDRVWSGPAGEAAQAIGDDWLKIQQFEPSRAWLAVYRHESLPQRTITVRAFRFSSRERAASVFAALRPSGAADFAAGDAGCWTELGVLFVWGDTLFELFGNDKDWEPAWQTVFIAGLLEKQLPPRK